MAVPARQTKENRGRNADTPAEIPSAGWRDIALRVKDELNHDNASIVAAGVAFYVVMALFPALAALVSIYGLTTEPHQVHEQIASLSSFLPQDARSIIDEQLTAVATNANTALSVGAAGGLLITLWSASKGMKALIESLNIAYNEVETRGFFLLTGVAIGLTVAGLLFLIISLMLIAILPTVLHSLGLGEIGETVLGLIRWPFMAMLVMTGLSILYRYAPCREKAQWQWVTWGSATATVLWIIGSLLFSIYVDNYGKYNETYGSLGAGVVLLMWFFVTAYIVLLGAEINSEMERQTKIDTTTGPPKAMGKRGAYAADTLGRVP